MVAVLVFMTLCISTMSLARNLLVVSGNVIQVEGMQIRLWGIRPPEADAVCRHGGAVDTCTAMSRWVLERLIGNEELRCSVIFGQLGSLVAAQCSVKGADLGHLMVLSGWATDNRVESGGFYALQEEVASEQKVGMWKDE